MYNNMALSIYGISPLLHMKLILVAVLVAAATARLLKPELDQEWVAFKQTHNKEYEGEEEAKRYKAILFIAVII
jgi:predicted tellurium resistance membrane protein TerC